MGKNGQKPLKRALGTGGRIREGKIKEETALEGEFAFCNFLGNNIILSEYERNGEEEGPLWKPAHGGIGANWNQRQEGRGGAKIEKVKAIN